jgi:hypothetical protein
MSVSGNNVPAPAANQNPSRGRPEADRVWDFKASHHVTAALTFALLIVVAFQLGTYGRQADLMQVQTSLTGNVAVISDNANTMTATIQRAFITITSKLLGVSERKFRP